MHARKNLARSWPRAGGKLARGPRARAAGVTDAELLLLGRVRTAWAHEPRGDFVYLGVQDAGPLAGASRITEDLGKLAAMLFAHDVSNRSTVSECS